MALTQDDLNILLRNVQNRKVAVKASKSITGQRVSIKPLSVNEAWKGRRFKTDKYRSFEKALLGKLESGKLCEPPYEFKYRFGFSNKLSDLVNPEKLVTDIICKKYSINDKDIYRMVLEREDVNKGNEFVQFEINQFITSK